MDKTGISLEEILVAYKIGKITLEEAKIIIKSTNRNDGRERLRNIVEKAGELFGIDVIVTEDLQNKSYIKGFSDGKKFIKKELLNHLQ